MFSPGLLLIVPVEMEGYNTIKSFKAIWGTVVFSLIFFMNVDSIHDMFDLFYLYSWISNIAYLVHVLFKQYYLSNIDGKFTRLI